MLIRGLGPADEAAAKAACRVFGESETFDVVPFLTRPEAHLFVATDGDDTAGWVYGHELVHPDGERTMLLYALDVDTPFQRRGIGKALVNAFVENARDLGCTEVWVLTDDANDAGKATYESARGIREPVDSVMYVWPLVPDNDTST